MKISNSASHPVKCIKCRKEIYTFEKRKTGRNKRVEHLKGQCNG